jgi:hypothetical protein
MRLRRYVLDMAVSIDTREWVGRIIADSAIELGSSVLQPFLNERSTKMKRLTTVFVILVTCLSLTTVSAVAEEPTAEDYMKFWKPLVGTWTFKIETDGEVAESTYRYLPSPSKRCYVAVNKETGGTVAQSLDGYDPERKCWKAIGFDSEATFDESLIFIENMKEVKQLSSGAKGTYRQKRVKSDGEVITQTGDWVWSEFDGEKGTLLLTHLMQDGEKQPDVKYTAERQSKRARRAKATR